MRKLKRLLLGLLLLLVFLISIAFSLWNSMPVPLSLGVMTLGPQPLAVWLIAAFCLGGFTGMLISLGLFRGLRSRYRIHRLEKQLYASEQALARLRGSAGEGEGDSQAPSREQGRQE